jgi:tetratricopeptide (TPR) repeat protein
MKKKTGLSSRKKAQQKRTAPSSPLLLDRRALEKAHADIQRILNQHDFASLDEANQFLQDLLQSNGGKPPDMPPTTPLQEAQEVMYQAWSASSRAQRIRLARKALMISPDCADAYVLLAEENAETPAEAWALYEAGVRAGERALEKEAFSEFAGNFWGILETRPYMRARFGLAQVIWYLGMSQEAITHLKEMLLLNPHDNQGVRYLLMNWLLKTGDDVSLEKLLDQYKDDWSANWKYSLALATFRKTGKSPQADAHLRDAIKFNTYVPAYLLGQKKPARQMPDFLSPGQESEALDYVSSAMTIWSDAEGALMWLREVYSAMPTLD